MAFTTHIRVVGVTFSNEDGKRRQDLLGHIYDEYWTEGREDEIKIELRHEPDNAYDSNAVGVYCIEPEQSKGRLGFVPADQAEFVKEALADKRVHKLGIDQMGCAGRGAKIYLKLSLRVLAGQDSPEEEVDEYCIEDNEGRVYDFE